MFLDLDISCYYLLSKFIFYAKYEGAKQLINADPTVASAPPFKAIWPTAWFLEATVLALLAAPEDMIITPAAMDSAWIIFVNPETITSPAVPLTGEF